MPNDTQPDVSLAQRILQRRLTALVEDAQNERTASNTTKALGLASLGLGCLAAVTTGGLATIPIGVGAIAYASAVIGQAKKTGRVMPLPFNDTGTGEMIGAAAGARFEAPDLEDYAFMSTQQKAEYAMILCCGNRMAHALAQLPSDQHRQFVYSIAKRRFMEMYGQHVKHTPELLMAVDAGEVAEYILATEDDFKKLRAGIEQQAALPPEPMPEHEPQPTRANIGSDTRLGAIAVPAAPVPAQPADDSFRTALTRGVLALRPETHLKLLAPSRGGKTNTLLHLLKDAGQVTYLTLKDSDRVPGHWKGYRLRPYNIHADVAAVLSEVQPLIAAILDGRSRETHWLVLDEALAVTDLLESQAETDEDKRVTKQFSSLIKLLLATGAAQGAMLALMSQTQNGSDIKGISAASLQNLWTVICGSERCADGFSHMPAWYSKHVDSLTGPQISELKKLDRGFYQLAAVRGEPLLCSFPQFEGDLKPCIVPGRMAYPNATEPTYGAVPQTDQQRLENAYQQSAGESVEDKVIAYLQKQDGFVPAWQIKSGVAELKNLTADEAKAVLNRMVDEGMIESRMEKGSLTYAATGTV
jgi:hypothetical protein